MEYTDSNIREHVRACEAKHRERMRVKSEKHISTLRLLDNMRQSCDQSPDDMTMLRLARLGAQVESADEIRKIRDAMVREAGRIALGMS